MNTPHEDICVNHNPRYNGCICECHTSGSQVIHCIPCCSPDDVTLPTEPVGELVDITKELRSHTFASHVILSGITHAIDSNLIKQLAVANEEAGGIYIRLTANGSELNFLEFCRQMEKQMDRMIAEKATEIANELVADKFRNISELATDLEDRLKAEINNHLEDWEDKL